MRKEKKTVSHNRDLSLEATGLSFGILLLSPSFTPSRLHSKVYKPCLEAHGASVTHSTVPVQCSTQWQCGTHHKGDSAALVWHTKHCQCDRAGTQDGGGGVSVRRWHVPAEVQKNTAVGVNNSVLYPVGTQTLDSHSWLAERQAHCFTPKMVWARCRRVGLPAWNAELQHGKSKLDYPQLCWKMPGKGRTRGALLKPVFAYSRPGSSHPARAAQHEPPWAGVGTALRKRAMERGWGCDASGKAAVEWGWGYDTSGISTMERDWGSHPSGKCAVERDWGYDTWQKPAMEWGWDCHPSGKCAMEWGWDCHPSGKPAMERSWGCLPSRKSTMERGWDCHPSGKPAMERGWDCHPSGQPAMERGWGFNTWQKPAMAATSRVFHVLGSWINAHQRSI